MQIGFITSNKGKLHELARGLKTSAIDAEVIQLSIDYPELQADTIEQVARFGLNWIFDNKNNPDLKMNFEAVDLIILEDSGLFVHALNNFPGVYSKYVYNTIGHHGVLELVNARAKRDAERKAHFESCIAMLEISKEDELTTTESPQIHIFKGECDGQIVAEPRGDSGFGFDPIFQPVGANNTFAEMEPDEKNRHSHRGRAILRLVEFFGSI